jgi:hypothetical protein
MPSLRAATGWLTPSRSDDDDGLIVIGVHTPEFAFEREIDGVRKATKERAIDYPVAVDNDYEIWNAFANHYWPAPYFVDSDGLIRDHRFGEGRYEESERNPSASSSVCSASTGNSCPSKGSAWRRRPTGTTCLRPRPSSATPAASTWRHPAASRTTNHALTRFQTSRVSTGGRSPANGQSGLRASRSTGPAEASPSASTRETRISCCLAKRPRRSLPVAHRRRSSGPVARRGRRREGQRRAPRRPHVPARPRTRRRRRSDAGDHAPRARRRGVRVHVRVAGLVPLLIRVRSPSRRSARRRAALGAS